MATGSPPLRLLLPTAWFVCVTPPPAHQDQQLINNLLNNIIPLNKQRHNLSDDPVATTYKIKAEQLDTDIYFSHLLFFVFYSFYFFPEFNVIFVKSMHSSKYIGML